MQYDFDRVLNRYGSNSLKWDTTGEIFGNNNVLPLWVADMDFPIAKPISDAIQERARHACYGYTMPGTGLKEAIKERLVKKYNWHIETDWLVFTPGVVPAINSAVKAYTHPGDDVVIQGPVYYPFWRAVTNNGCRIANNQLKFNGERYEMDFNNLEEQFCPRDSMRSMPSRTRMMILCNPHNPVGRVWTIAEQERAGELILKNNAIMVSDEIHCELLFKGIKHTPFASIRPEFAQNSITCMAPSKTFNLAGLGASVIIIPNKKLREQFEAARDGILPRPNVFGLVAMEAAFRYGDEWLGQLLEYLQGNLEFLMDYFRERIPQIKPVRPQGTYLIWLDCRALGLNNQKLRDFMRNKAEVGLDDGYLFGPSGSGFQRINIACPRSILKEALGRIEKAVQTIE